ncbi:hypothetical protein LCGC14_2233230 [marine sediment metagenome]|uniref:Uncharacterized protein n=1 Tax=marine sediment metagenome TaxID=412755 RepID=A0A0F9D7C8_9ZZZZ
MGKNTTQTSSCRLQTKNGWIDIPVNSSTVWPLFPDRSIREAISNAIDDDVERLCLKLSRDKND